MEIWIGVTIAAAAAQTVRFMLQKQLRTTGLSTAGATFARFVYSAPLIAVLMLSYATYSDQVLPPMSARFWGFEIIGGTAQILATLCVVALFSERNFAVGITFKKTEVLQTAIVGFVVLGEGISLWATLAVLLGFVAVLFLSQSAGEGGKKGWYGFFNRAVALGLASGVFFAFSAVSYRGASLSLGSGDVALRASYTLAMVTAGQTLGMGLWFALRDRQQVGAVFRAWRVAGAVGIASMIGSFCWFTAFTLQNATYVNALGQIELVFSLAASVLFFREKISGRELTGIGLLLSSILLLLLVT